MIRDHIQFPHGPPVVHGPPVENHCHTHITPDKLSQCSNNCIIVMLCFHCTKVKIEMFPNHQLFNADIEYT